MAFFLFLTNHMVPIGISMLGLCFLITFHEFGHFIFAKIFNVSTPTFSIGFGPRLVEKKIGDTVFTISAIPFGGYVEVAGNHEIGQGEQKEANRNDERSFANKTIWQKLTIMLGGILFNLIFAAIAYSILFFTGAPNLGGLSNSDPATISYIEENSPANKSGLLVGDTIISINNNKINNISEYTTAIENKNNQEISATIKRSSETINIENIKLGELKLGDKTLGMLGVQWASAPKPLLKSICMGFMATVTMSKNIFSSLIHIIKEKKGGALSGPLMIVAQGKKFAQAGFKSFLFLMALISINLAIINLVPLPIFDGGQILFLLIESIIRRPLPDTIKYYIHLSNWILLMGLLVYLSFKDIVSLAGLENYILQLKTIISNLFSK